MVSAHGGGHAHLPGGQLAASFRDPSGFMFRHEGRVLRQVNKQYQANFEALKSSGLFAALFKHRLLIEHQELDDLSLKQSDECLAILEPEQLPFVSYPYEWSFSQLKDAALLTLKIQALALKHGFMLKDASAYNVQFLRGAPVFIDTLSFEVYTEGTPWPAYKQFCEHFLAPLALMSHCDIALSKLLVTYIDGIPLGLASKLLPTSTRLNYSLLAHIHSHAKVQDRYADAAADSDDAVSKAKNKAQVSKKGVGALTESLGQAVNKLNWSLPKTEWGDYYDNTNYSGDADQAKKQLVENFLKSVPGPLSIVQDLGANTGAYSRIAAKHSALTVAQDIDPVAVERNYLQLKADKSTELLPLVQDLFNPSPAIGWGNTERDSFIDRSGADVVMALALIHHLAISNNVPLTDIAKVFAQLSAWLIIEFVPKEDSQVRRLLASRDDIFPNYTLEGFEKAFSHYYNVEQKSAVGDSERTLFLLKKR